MPIIASAIKRVRQQEKRRKRNLVTINSYRRLIKEFTILIKEGKKAEATKLYPLVQKAIDMAAKKNILHKNNAGRKKSQLAKMISSKTTTKTTTKTTVKSKENKSEKKVVKKAIATKK
jgi:small subunit ribosomal protein S20